MIAPIQELREIIRDRYGCDSTWVEYVQVKETFQGTVWDDTVEVFDLIDHPKASRCYAWSHAVDESDERRYVAVLHEGTVDSPQAAVRAAIVQEQRGPFLGRFLKKLVGSLPKLLLLVGFLSMVLHVWFIDGTTITVGATVAMFAGGLLVGAIQLVLMMREM